MWPASATGRLQRVEHIIETPCGARVAVGPVSRPDPIVKRHIPPPIRCASPCGYRGGIESAPDRAAGVPELQVLVTSGVCGMLRRMADIARLQQPRLADQFRQQDRV